MVLTVCYILCGEGWVLEVIVYGGGDALVE